MDQATFLVNEFQYMCLYEKAKEDIEGEDKEREKKTVCARDTSWQVTSFRKTQ